MNERGSGLWQTQFKAAATHLHADFGATADVGHAPTQGTYREGSFGSFLRRYVPRRFEIGTGLAIDTKGRQSNQIDIAIFDTWNSPTLLTKKGVHLIPIECLYGVIEVKSTLTAAGLDQAIEHFQNLMRMEREYYDPQHGKRSLPPEVAFAVFAYRGMQLGKIIDYLAQSYASTPANQQIHSVYVLGQGVAVRGASAGHAPYSSTSTEWQGLSEVDHRYPEYDGFAWTFLNLIEQLIVTAGSRPRMSLEPYMPG